MNIIFDFDGTIADTFYEVIDAFQELTHHQYSLAPEEIERLKGMPALQVCKELKIPLWRVSYLVVRGRKLMTKRMPRVKPIEGIAAVLKELEAHGHSMYVVSSNSNKNIKSFLERHRVNTLFTHIYGEIGLFGKTPALRRVLKSNHLNKKQTIYVGDEARDVQAAHKVGLEVVAVSWGYNSKGILLKQKPSSVATTPEELLKAVNKLAKKSV